MIAVATFNARGRRTGTAHRNTFPLDRPVTLDGFGAVALPFEADASTARLCGRCFRST